MFLMNLFDMIRYKLSELYVVINKPQIVSQIFTGYLLKLIDV